MHLWPRVLQNLIVLDTYTTYELDVVMLLQRNAEEASQQDGAPRILPLPFSCARASLLNGRR